ncbi:hypothetical protein [Longirhabdus pacifica]|uniref:hypothetical protein n=1 Tax=Longirhabdus pacifica TaxID=2305227 RepID=UPI0010090520|nr:hypothetical protein [Longirhabdus pacifica]
MKVVKQDTNALFAISKDKVSGQAFNYRYKFSTQWKAILMYMFPYIPSLYLCSLNRNKPFNFKQYELQKNITLLYHPDATLAFRWEKEFKYRLSQFLNDDGIQGEVVQLEKSEKSDIENKKNKLIETICVIISFIVFFIMMKDTQIFYDAFHSPVQPNKIQGLFFIIAASGGGALARLIFTVKDAKYLYEKLKHKEKIESKHIKQFLIHVGSAIGFGVLYSIHLYILYIVM